MSSINYDPYEKSYNLTDIKSGLSFYYNYLNQVDPNIFTDENFPIKRGEIITTLKYLEGIPKKHQVNNLVQSHPFLTQAIESIESFNEIENKNEHFKFSKYFMYIWIENLLFSGCFILYHKFQFEYQDVIKNKEPKEIIKILIEQKAYLKKNTESYSKRYLKFVFDFIEIEIEKYTAIKGLESEQGISKEANELIIDYLNQIKTNNENNNLYSSLKKKEYDNFIYKFKRLLFIPSYYDITKSDRERVFHVYLLAALQGRLDNYLIKSNKESGLGRYDISLNPIDKRDPGIIIEIKKVDENIEQDSILSELNSALDQIETKQYFFELIEEGVKQIVEISLVFTGLEPKIKWKIKK